MQRTILSGVAALALAHAIADGQITRTTVPLGETLTKALTTNSLTDGKTQPFHVRIVISEPENSQSPNQGTIEEWWVSPQQWRRDVTAKDGLRQTIVYVNGKKTEKDEGDYFPLWLRQFVMAVFDPVPNAAAWTASGLSIEQITMPNGQKSDACVRGQSTIGSGDRATSAFSNVCFDGEGRLKFYGSPRYSMEFHDYRKFGHKHIAYRFVDDPEAGTELVGQVTVLEDESAVKESSIFSPLPANDDFFRSIEVSSAEMEKLSAENTPVVWPTIISGKTTGHLAMYVSVDRQGRVREAWPLNSDNATLDDSAREQVRKWTMKIATDQAGNAIQVDGGLGFAFGTKIANSASPSAPAESSAPTLPNKKIRVSAGVAKGLLVQATPLNYPDKTKPGAMDGAVTLHVIIGTDGKVISAEVLSAPDAALGNAALESVRGYLYRPFLLNGEAIAMDTLVEVRLLKNR